MPRVPCPHCRRNTVIPSTGYGRRTRCDHCDADFTPRRSGTPAWVAGLVAGFVLLALAGGVALVVGWRALKRGGDVVGGAVGDAASAVTGPTPEREGETWTHEELFRYLRGRGAVAEMTDRNPAALQGPAANLKDAAGRSVLVQKFGTAGDAKDRAAVVPGKGFAWGRFLFFGDADLVARIKASLVG